MFGCGGRALGSTKRCCAAMLFSFCCGRCSGRRFFTEQKKIWRALQVLFSGMKPEASAARQHSAYRHPVLYRRRTSVCLYRLRLRPTRSIIMGHQCIFCSNCGALFIFHLQQLLRTRYNASFCNNSTHIVIVINK